MKNAYIDFSISAQFYDDVKTENDRIVDIELTMDYNGYFNSYTQLLSENTNKTRNQIEADKNEVWQIIIKDNPPERKQNEHGVWEIKSNKYSFIWNFSLDNYLFTNYFSGEMLQGGFIVNSQGNKMRMTFIGLGDFPNDGPLEIELTKKVDKI
jgi:hypothetical protein